MWFVKSSQTGGNEGHAQHEFSLNTYVMAYRLELTR